ISGDRLSTLINPLPHLLVLGSGVDMISLCELALAVGWRVTLADQRLSDQRRAGFPDKVTFLKSEAKDLDPQLLQQVDGVVIAHHNVALDAAALAALQGSAARYVGLLGPAIRKTEVMAVAGLTSEELTTAVA